MNTTARATAAILVFVVGIVGIAAALFFVFRAPVAKKVEHATTRPTTTTAPATQPVVQGPPRTYGELLKVAYPQIATTQPLGISLDLSDAAHIVLTDPVHVCSRLDLWITRDDADPAERVLAKAIDEQTHLTRDPVLFVHWAPDERGKYHPRLVCRRDGGGDASTAPAGADFVSPTSRTPIPGKHVYLWHRAFSWGDRFVVPTESGISILAPGDPVTEIHHEFATAESSSDPSAPPAEPQVTFDAKGIIAWMPWDAGRRGSAGAVRFTDGQFSPLSTAEGWPEKLVHVVPLLDGSVLQIVRGDDGRIQPKLTVLSAPVVDEPKVTALVDQLSDPDPEKRQQAYNELTRYGSGIWPLLEKLMDDQPIAAQVRLQQLLANRLRPTLGGITLVDGELTTASRLPDGGVVFFAPAGVSFPRENADPQIVKPAWISVRPGKAIEILPEKLLKDAAPPKHQVYAFGEEWVLSDDEKGPQQLLYNHKTALLRDNEKEFGRLHAIDRRGRWLFRKSGEQNRDSRETLILDPTFADPTPRLPIWLMEIRNGTVGWDEKNWPVIKSGGAWALRERGWQALDEKKKERMLTNLPANGSAGATDQPLLVDADGNRYFDGAALLHVISKSGKHTVWPLSTAARGTPSGTLLCAKDGRLFLFNQPGRVLRIKPTPGADQPFKLEGSFTHRVPTSERIARIWIDDANRICVAYDDNRLAILFPEGVIPPHIATMIPANELR
ncbi:MAG: hypothetical protein WBD40_19110 [Tepidisphaeraceae bacterium]